MSTARLPVPDPPGTVWREAGNTGIGKDGEHVTVAHRWVDDSTRYADLTWRPGWAYRRYRIETLDGLLLTFVITDDDSCCVVQYGSNPEAIKVLYSPFCSVAEIEAWARECRDYERSAA